MSTENSLNTLTIAEGETLRLQTRFGGLSRGKCWGKYYPNKKTPAGAFEWVRKQGGTLYLEGPGYYVVGSDDGFSRKAQGAFYLAPKTEE